MNLTPNPAEIGLFFTKTGSVPTSAYNQPLAVPQGGAKIKFWVSALGGNLVWLSVDGNVYAKELLPGREYAIMNVKQVLSGPVNDWQNNSQTNDITDLTWEAE